MSSRQSGPAVVVGVDGSRTALHAALWAIDEAVARDVPLRLVYVIDSPPVPGGIAIRSAKLRGLDLPAALPADFPAGTRVHADLMAFADHLIGRVAG